MSTYTCPDGHTSQSGDYCDVCGLPIQGSAGSSVGSGAGSSAGSGAGSTPAPSPLPPPMPPPMPRSTGPHAGSPASSASSLSLDAPAAATRTCPNCSTDNPADALFCENCGYDFTTGQLPRPLAPPDPAGAQPVPPPAAPDGTVEWVAEVWVDPDWYAAQGVADPLPSVGAPAVVPLAERTVLVGRTSTSRNIHPQIDCSADSGVSRRHAQLSTDGQRWWVEDLQSSNGTYVGGAGEPLPTTPLPPGQRVELADDDRVYVGGWTRIVVRRAASGEI